MSPDTKEIVQAIQNSVMGICITLCFLATWFSDSIDKVIKAINNLKLTIEKIEQNRNIDKKS